MGNLFRRIIRLMLVISMLPVPSVDAASNYYNVEATLQYAKEYANVDDGTVCDQFVKAALKKGNIEILAGDVDPVKDALLKAEYGSNMILKLNEDGRHINISDNPSLKPGDIMFFYCDTCGDNTHTAIVGGWDEAGNVFCYGHNPGWDEDDNEYGVYRHRGHDKVTYCDSYWTEYTAVSMDTDVKTHWHNFSETDNNGKYYYEKAHPHPMYAKCKSCDIAYYLGWDAKEVTSCTECNPPLGDNPVITTCRYVEGDKKYIELKWSTVYNVVSYNVHRAKSKDGTYFNLGNVKSPNMNNTSVDIGIKYWYKIEAVLENGEKRWSEPVSVVAGVVSDKLLPPTISVSDKDGKPYLKWVHIDGATEYVVYRSTTKDFKDTDYTYTTSNTSLKNENALNGNIYYYKVVAVAADERNNSESSNIVEFKMPKLSTPVAKVEKNPEYNNAPQVKWDRVAGAVEYEVYRAKSLKGEYQLIYTTDKISYTNTDVKKGQSYYYKIKAVARVKDLSSDLSEVCVFIPEGKKLEATKATVSAHRSGVYKGYPQIKWSRVPQALKYEVYRAESENGEYVKVRETTGLSYTNTAVTPDKTYYYKVKALAGSEVYNSEFSNTVKFKTAKNKKPQTVTDMGRQPTGYPRIRWTKVNGASRYEVWRSVAGENNFELVTISRYLTHTNTCSRGGEYEYKVRPVYADGTKGVFSNIVKVTAYLKEPTVTIAANENYDDKPQLKWNSIYMADMYEVYRADSVDGEFKKVYTTKYKSYTNTAAESGKTYYYKVKAVDKTGNIDSGFSNTEYFEVK